MNPWDQVRAIALELRERARSMGKGELPLFLTHQAGALEALADSIDVLCRSCSHPKRSHNQGGCTCTGLCNCLEWEAP